MDTTRNTLSISEALYHLSVMMLTLGHGGQSMPVPTDVPMCTASETAQYRLTFTGKWTQAAFPKQYPVYRPPAQWSNLIGKSIISWSRVTGSWCRKLHTEKSFCRDMYKLINAVYLMAADWYLLQHLTSLPLPLSLSAVRGDSQLRLPHLAA